MKNRVLPHKAHHISAGELLRLEADAEEVLASAAELLKSEPNMVKLQASLKHSFKNYINFSRKH